jgi:hypothetical protein
MSRDKQTAGRGNVVIVKGTHFSAGGRSTNPSKTSVLGIQKCIATDVVAASERFDIIQKGIHEPIRQRDCEYLQWYFGL